jgi:hypothetical protein
VLVNERPIGPERGARFVVRGARATRDGDLPAGAPLTLPAGEYHVTVSAPLCAGFDGPVTVNVGAQTPLRIPLICP